MKEIRTVTLRGDALTVDSIARALDFPSFAGRNLDALFDCLTDLPPTVLFVQNPHATPANARILKVLYAAAAANPRLWLYVQ